MRRCELGIIAVISVIMLTYIPLNVSAHTPSKLTSILTSDGPKPENITQSTDFFEGDTVWFLMKDDAENVTMRVSIDIDGDGFFNESTDVFSSWMNFSCELNENGTETLDENCTVEFEHLFPANNSTGTYYYQVERRVEENYTNSWINSIYVGIDVHTENGVPNIGDCFGAGCDENSEDLVESKSNGFELGLVEILIIISATGVVGLSISIIKENKLVEDKTYSQGPIQDQYSEE